MENQVWRCKPVIPVTLKAEVGGLRSKASLNKSTDPVWKKKKQQTKTKLKAKGLGGMADAIQCMSSKYEALSSNSSPAKKKKTREKVERKVKLLFCESPFLL
jgi:hypothetical protein